MVPSNFLKAAFHKFIWSILEYFVLYDSLYLSSRLYTTAQILTLLSEFNMKHSNLLNLQKQAPQVFCKKECS